MKECFPPRWMAMIAVLVASCTQTVTVYWSKPGSGPEELQQDKEECRALQRAAGTNEEHIEKCLEAKGWWQAKKEIREEPAPEE